MIHYSNSFLQFITDKRGSSNILHALYDYHSKCDSRSYYGYENALKPYFTTSLIDYLTFRTNGKISYLPAGKEHIVNPDGTWNKKNRVEGTPTRVIRKLFTKEGLEHYELNDTDFETFTNMYKASFNDEGFEFKILPNTSIKDVYCMNRAEGESSLNNSCMNGDANYLNIYTHCKQLEIVTLCKGSLLAGRALLWSLKDDIKLMDRIYVAEDFMYQNFIDYANENGFWHKVNYMNYQYPTDFIKPDGTRINQSFIIETPTNFGRYPYIDTFRYGLDGILTNSEYFYRYTDTCGGRNY